MASLAAEQGSREHRLQQLCCVGSLCAELRLSGCVVWTPYVQSTGSVVAMHGPAAPWRVGSSRTQDRTCVLCTGRWTLNYWITREVITLFSYITHAPSKNCMKCWSPEPTFSSHVTTEYCSRQVSNHCEARTLQMDPALTWVKSPDKSFWDRGQWWAGASLLHISCSNCL